MEPIYIPQLLKAPEKTESIEIQEFISDLETLTPVRGEMMVTHCGNYLEVSLVAEAIVTLACDRCLQQYNHRLSIDSSELIWLEENSDQTAVFPSEREVQLEDLSETLDPRGYFHPDTWLYEQMSLALPMRRLCDQNCPGTVKAKIESEPLLDRRWATLAKLKQQLPQ